VGGEIYFTVTCIRRSLLISATVLTCTLVLGWFTPNGIRGQQFDPNLYSGMHWRMIGPFRGGRALTAVGVPGQPSVF